ncbi:outer membrane protein [Ostreiculturibacter nitratireducens]|uniref:outer membrane protein n=1 Tax=Ostreiculturibacter nitratireducens TaxID=3075226 RepID=UPI0031B5A5CA
MKKAVRFALLSALAAPLAAPAMAGGLSEPVVEPAPAPAPVVVAPVTGDWTGGYVGLRLGYGNVDAGADEGDGVLYGLGAGYDYDFGSWVLGATLNYDASEIELDGGAGSIDSIARLGLRAGADLGNTLVYATAGAAYADGDIGGTSYSDTGWYGGIGAEYMMGANWSLGGELLLHKFDDFDGSGVDVDATTVGLNANFRF